MCRIRLLSITLFISLLLLSRSSVIIAAIIIPGDKEAAPGTSLRCSLRGHQIEKEGGGTFFAAAPTQEPDAVIETFAVSYLSVGKNELTPLACPEATVNGIEKAPSPLYNARIRFLSLMEGECTATPVLIRPVLVLENEPRFVCALVSVSDKESIIYCTSAVNDAQIMPELAQEIIGIAASRTLVYAAVVPQGGIFGDIGSGLAVSILGTITTTFEGKTEPETKSVFIWVDAGTGAFSNRALPFNRSSPEVAIGSDVISLSQTPQLFFDNSLNRLFVGVGGEGGAGATDGIRAITVGRSGNAAGQLLLTPIVPESALIGSSDPIIGGVGSNSSITIAALHSLRTSTGLYYLIVGGGTTTSVDVQRSVFALPLVTGSVGEASVGTIASKLQDPFNHFLADGTFLGRSFPVPATTAEEMTQATDAAALVGGGPLPDSLGIISDMDVLGDSVFVATTGDDSQQPGVFYSRALFNEKGAIVAWTQWNRSTAIAGSVSGVLHPDLAGQITYLTPTDDAGSRTVKRTLWQSSSEAASFLGAPIATNFPSAAGGITTVRDIPVGTDGLDSISMTIFGGRDRIMMVQTGLVDGQSFLPTEQSALLPVQKFSNGTIENPITSNVVVIQGGVLSALGPITAVTVATNDAGEGWLVVGGIGGLALLSAADGSGWDTTTGLGDLFDGIATGMSFKEIAGYQFVRTVIADKQYLYVVTDDFVDRIDMSSGAPGLGGVARSRVADRTLVPELKKQGGVLDGLFSGPLGVLATSNGLFRIRNGLDIRSIASTQPDGWVLIISPELLPPATQLVVATPSGIATRSVDDGANISLISAYSGQNRSFVYRFYIANNGRIDPVDDSSLQFFPDYFEQDRPSYYLDFGSYRRHYFSDGAITYSARSGDSENGPQLWQLSLSRMPFSGERFAGMFSRPTPLLFSGGTIISTLTDISATGQMVVVGDFGMQSKS